MSPIDLLLIALLIACFAGAAALSIAEVSILRVRRTEILLDARHPQSRANRLLGLLDDLPIVLNCVLLAVLLVQVTAATIAGTLAGRWFGGLGVTIATFIITMVLFVYGEAIPKTMAVRAPRAMAMRMTPLLRILVTMIRRPVAVLVRLADLQIPGATVSTRTLTEAELRALAHEAAELGEIGTGDVALVDRSFEFNDRRVDEVMVARDQIRAVNRAEPLADALRQAIAFGHRRLPVCGADLDDIVGVVRLRDIASLARAAPHGPVERAATSVLRARPEQLISELLRQMQASGRWLAIVTDDTGRTVGLATIEDVVAELVGEIADETESLGLEVQNDLEEPDDQQHR